VRKLVTAASADDIPGSTTPISTAVVFEPIYTTSYASLRLMKTYVTLAEDSADVTLECYSGESVQAAVEKAIAATSPSWSRTVSSGRMQTIANRVRGNAIVFRMAASVSGQHWAFESLDTILEAPAGIARRSDRQE
jgi:hypothetical protein